MARTQFRFLYTWVFTVNPKGLSPKQLISYFQVCATKRSPDVRTPDLHHVEQYNVDACYYTWWTASSLDRRREPWTTCLNRCCFMTMSSATAVCEPHKRNFEPSLLLNFSCKTLLPNFHVLIEILFSYVLVWFIVWLFALHVQGVSKVCSDFLFAQISLIILKIFFLKLSMLFIIHLTLNN